MMALTKQSRLGLSAGPSPVGLGLSTSPPKSKPYEGPTERLPVDAKAEVSEPAVTH